MKKLIAILLAVVLVVGAVPTLSVTAFAQSLDSVTAALAPRGDVGLGTNYPGGTDVLVVDPFEGTDGDLWDNTSENVGTYIKGLFGGTGSCNVLSGAEATNEAILEAMFSGDYAVILIDSHGSPSSFSTRASNGTGMTSFNANTVRQYRKDAEEEGKSLHLNNALVYFSACSIMADYEDADSLSSELKASGAGVVIGDTEISYAYPDIKKNFIWCLTGFYDGEVYNAQDAFNKAITRESFVWDGNGSWELRENGKPTPEGGSGSCGTNVSYRLYSENGKKLLYIYPTSTTPGLDYSMKNYDFSSVPWKGACITHLTIEYGVTSIGNRAFELCAYLTSVTIPDSVTSIGDYAFNTCTNLTSVTIPDSVTSIGDYAFERCTSLNSVTIPNSVTSIGDAAFYSCTSLNSVTIPDSVTSIGSSAFANCSNLESATVNCSILGDYMFDRCSKLSNVTLNENITSIPYFCFYGTALTEFTVSENVTEIGYNAFVESKLESIYFESSAAVPTISGEMHDDGRCATTFYADQFPYYFEKKYGRAPELIDLLVTYDYFGYNTYGMYSVEDWYEECSPDVSSVEEVTIDWFMEDYGFWSEDYADYTTIVNAYNNAATLQEKEEALKTLYRWKNHSGETGLDEYDEDRINQFAAWYTYGFVNEFRETYGREPQLLDMLVSLDYNWWPECDYFSVEAWYEEEGPDVSSAEEVTVDWFMDWNDGYGFWSEDYADYHPLVEAYEAAQTKSARIDALTELFAAHSTSEVYDASFPFNTTIYYPLGSTAWEDTLTVEDGKIKHGIYNVATNAVAFVDGEESSVEFMGVNETVTLSSGPALNSEEGRIVLGWYDGAAGANTSYTATAANVQTLDGVTYASETPLQKVLTSKYRELGTVAKADDGKITGKSTYKEMELFGVQIRDTGKNDGLRFMVALSENIYDTLSSLDGNQNAVDYGFIAGSKAKLDLNAEGTKLENGTAHSTKVSCASDGAIDHYNGTDYRLYTLVITYASADDPNMSTDIAARAYLKYTDANGVVRYYYSNYDSPTAYAGGCCTNYNAAKTYIDNVLRA